MHTNTSLQQADAVAVRAGVDLVASVTPADLSRATPCRGWDLGALLAHMTTQHLGFAAAADGHGADPQVWRTVPLGADPARTYADAAERVIAAFAADGVLDRPFALPEISTEMTFPGRRAIGFHLVDYVAHGWDVATSLGVPFHLPEDVLELALPIAEAVPAGPARTVPGAAFGPVVPVAGDADRLTRILALLGRA
jgi:uncharacterized protein (TIGR03086 family)